LAISFDSRIVYVPGYYNYSRAIGIGESNDDNGNNNNNNNIYIIISTRRRKRRRRRHTTNNAWADNEHYYHGGHTPRSTRSRYRVRSRTSAGAKGQCRPGRDYTVGNVRAVRPNSRRNTDEKLRSVAPPPPRIGNKVPPTLSLPTPTNADSFCYAARTSHYHATATTTATATATTAADVFLMKELTK